MNITTILTVNEIIDFLNTSLIGGWEMFITVIVLGIGGYGWLNQRTELGVIGAAFGIILIHMFNPSTSPYFIALILLFGIISLAAALQQSLRK